MEYNQVPKKYRDEWNGGRHGSMTIQSDVNDSIDKADDWLDAQGMIEQAMIELIGEAQHTIEKLADKPNYALIHAVQEVTGETVEEVKEGDNQVWYIVDGKWYFMITGGGYSKTSLTGE